MPEPEGQRLELIGGEVVTTGRGGFQHEWVKGNVIEILLAWILQNRSLKLLSEAAYELVEHNSPIPDISVVSRQGVHAGAELIQGAPVLAIEIVSSESAAGLETKVTLYLARGAKSVWVVFLELRLVRIYDSSGPSRKFEENETLEDPTVLPGFQSPVSAFSEGI